MSTKKLHNKKVLASYHVKLEGQGSRRRARMPSQLQYLEFDQKDLQFKNFCRLPQEPPPDFLHGETHPLANVNWARSL